MLRFHPRNRLDELQIDIRMEVKDERFCFTSQKLMYLLLQMHHSPPFIQVLSTQQLGKLRMMDPQIVPGVKGPARPQCRLQRPTMAIRLLTGRSVASQCHRAKAVRLKAKALDLAHGSKATIPADEDIEEKYRAKMDRVRGGLAGHTTLSRAAVLFALWVDQSVPFHLLCQVRLSPSDFLL